VSELPTSEVKGKVQKRSNIGDETFLQEAETSVKTRHFKNETYTTYDSTWTETVNKSRTVTYETGRSWRYPCPGAGYWQISYGTRTENYTEEDPKSGTVTRLTNTAYTDSVQPKTTGTFRTVSRLSSGAIVAAAGVAGAAGAGSDLGFSGDTGAGSSTARASSAGKSKKIAGATKAILTRNFKAFDASGTYAGGGKTLILGAKGDNEYDLTYGSYKAVATYNSGQGKIQVGKGAKASVDLTFGGGGNTLSGSIRGDTVNLTKN
jgi:hypothetical protein